MKQIRWVGAALLAFSFASAVILPAWAGFENGPIEVGQVVLLLGGAIIALLYAIRNQTRLRWFWLAVSLIWTVLALRELSWGGVFLAPLLMSEQGPYFSSTQLWYKPYIFPALFAVALVVGAFFIKGKALYVLKFPEAIWPPPGAFNLSTSEDMEIKGLRSLSLFELTHLRQRVW